MFPAGFVPGRGEQAGLYPSPVWHHASATTPAGGGVLVELGSDAVQVLSVGGITERGLVARGYLRPPAVVMTSMACGSQAVSG